MYLCMLAGHSAYIELYLLEFTARYRPEALAPALNLSCRADSSYFRNTKYMFLHVGINERNEFYEFSI